MPRIIIIIIIIIIIAPMAALRGECGDRPAGGRNFVSSKQRELRVAGDDDN